MAPSAKVCEEICKRNSEYVRLLLEGPKTRVGVTPKDVVWSLNKSTLYHYRPSRKRHYSIPVLIIYALINRPYILDLAPGRSLVSNLVDLGFDVYLLDWGSPGLEDRGLSFGDYVTKYIPRAVKKIQRLSGSREFTILGYCMGGTMSSMYAAIYPDAGLKNLILAASPVDFSYHPYFSQWFRNKYFDLDRLVDVLGVIPGQMIDWGNKMLKPVQNYLSSEVSLWHNSLNAKFTKDWAPVNKWINDGPNFPGEAFRQWIGDLYQKNKMVKGEFILNGYNVDLRQIKANLLAIGATQDHIVLPEQVRAALDCFGSSDKEYYEVDSGHVSLIISGKAAKKTWPKLTDWLDSRSGTLISSAG